MTIRTSSRTVTFIQPFALSGLDGVQPAGSYTVDTDEERLDTVLSPGWRRIMTSIQLHETPDRPGVTRTMTIEPEELDAALRRDAAPAEKKAETRVEAQTVSFARRQAHRAHKKTLFDIGRAEST